MAEKNDTFDKFKNVLIENGAEFEVSSNFVLITTESDKCTY